MNILKVLFGNNTENSKEAEQSEASKQFDILKYDGVRALRTGQWKQAIDCFNYALGMREDPECRDYLSQALLHNDNIAEARQQLEKLGTLAPDNAQVWIRMAQTDFALDDYDRMIEDCEKALTLTGDNSDIYYYLGRAYMGKKETEKAIEMFGKSLAANEQNISSRLTRAGIMLDEGKLDEATADSKWLTENAGEMEETVLLKARIEAAGGQTEQALSSYDRAVELNPFSPEALRERAALRKKVGDEAGAADDLAALRELTPENHEEDIEQKMNETYRNANPYGF